MYQRPHPRSEHPVRKPRRFARLPGGFDPAPLVAELRAVAPWFAPAAELHAATRSDEPASEPPPPWIASQWKWHLGTYFLVLRGGPPTTIPGGMLTSGAGVDAPLLDQLPAHRALLDAATGPLPAPAALAWIGLSPPGARIHLHVDNTRHWDEHHRVHLPLVTTPAARLCVDRRFLHFPAGTCWAIDNSAPHGAHNAGPARLHLMVDLPPTPAVEAWMAAGEVIDGDEDPATLAALAADPLAHLGPRERADPALLGRLLRQ
ncbi:MAG: aspartyl/asparaginyl beta-hydroxylase domain-containing protein [Myxococcales bacterium]|nr:aspartyl/asparaginyl beta-hydroxylase domain-containing protein [Myxococcales bacterium]